MGTFCAPLFADLFLYGYRAKIIQRLLKADKEYLAQKFNFNYMNIDAVLSLNILKLIDLIYQYETEIKNSTEPIRGVLYYTVDAYYSRAPDYTSV